MDPTENDFMPAKIFIPEEIFKIVDWNNDGLLDVITQSGESELTIMLHTDEGQYEPFYSIAFEDPILDFEIMNANLDEFADLVIATNSILEGKGYYSKLHIYTQDIENESPVFLEFPDILPFIIGNNFSTELQIGNFSNSERDDIGITNTNGEVTTNYLLTHNSETDEYKQKFGFLNFRIGENIDLINTGNYIHDDSELISRFNSSLNNSKLTINYYIESGVEHQSTGSLVFKENAINTSPLLFESINKIVAGDILANDIQEEFIVLSDSGNLVVNKSENYGLFFQEEDIHIGSGGIDAVVVDIDNDGDKDIIIAGMGDQNELVNIYKNDGSDSYNLEKTITTNLGISSLVVADEDNNGLLDLIVGTNDGSSYVLNQFENTHKLYLPIIFK